MYMYTHVHVHVHVYFYLNNKLHVHCMLAFYTKWVNSECLKRGQGVAL